MSPRERSTGTGPARAWQQGNRSTRWGRLVALAGVAALAMLVYWRAAGFGFFYDDPNPNFRTMEGISFAGLFASPSGYGYYRPVTFGVWKLLLALSGGQYGAAFHVFSLAVQGANAAMLWLLALRWSGKSAYAWAVALGFAAFPFSYEAVGYVAALFHPLLVLFALGMFLFYEEGRRSGRRGYYILAFVALGLALFTHENGVVLPLILLGWDLMCRPPRRAREWLVRPATIYLLGPALFGAIWLAMLGSAGHGLRPWHEVWGNVWPFVQALVYPLLLLARLNAAQRGTLLGLALGTLAGAYLLAWAAKARRLWGLAVGWVALAALPTLLLLEHDYLYHGPRLLYLAAVGIAFLWGLPVLALERLAKGEKWRRAGARTLQAGLVAALALGPLPFIACQLDYYAHTSRLMRAMAAVARGAPEGKELVFVNLPYYYTGYREHPTGCANPYPQLTLAAIVFPPYAQVRDFVRVNGGPDRPARGVYYAGYDAKWVPYGEEVSASRLRAMLDAGAEVFACDVATGTLYNLAEAWRANPRPGPESAVIPYAYLEPLYHPPELVTAEEIASAQVADITYGEALGLVGYRLGAEQVLPGQENALTLIWQAKGGVRPNLKVHLRLQDRFGGVVTEEVFAPVAGLGTALWREGAIYATRHMLHLAPNMAYGIATLRVSLRAEADGRALAARGAQGEALGEEPQVASFLVGERSELDASPPGEARHEVLGGAIALDTWEGPAGALQPGEALPVTLYWRAKASLTANYTVFVQLLNDKGELVVGHDGEPNGGKFPTSTWSPGKIVRDGHTLALPANLAPGRYTLLVGMYEWPAMQRLGVTVAGAAQGDVIKLGEVVVASQ